MDYAHFPPVFRGSCPVPGCASLSNDDDTNIHYYLYVLSARIPFTCDGGIRTRRVFMTAKGMRVGGKDVVIIGAGTGGCLTQSGWEAMGAKIMVARDGYVSVGIDSTTDSRPVHLGNSRPIVTCLKPCRNRNRVAKKTKRCILQGLIASIKGGSTTQEYCARMR